MACAGCKRPCDSVLRGTDTPLCASCIRLADQYCQSLRIRNSLRIESSSWAKAPSCLVCDIRFKPREDEEVCTLCTIEMMDYLYRLGVKLSDNPLVYRLVKPWMIEGVYRFWPRFNHPVYEVVTFESLDGNVVTTEIVESQNNFFSGIDILDGL